MTTYAFPSVTPNDSSIELLSNTQQFISPFSGMVQTIDRGGERWGINMQFRHLTDDDRATMQAFLAQLNGQQHRFTLHNHAEPQRGAFGGSPLVDGASQTGVTLDIDGCSATITNWIRKGDWFGVNGELKISTSDEDSDGAGDLTLSFAPRLRSAPADNAVITIAAATGVFMLADNGVRWSNSPGGFSSLSIMAVEDIAS